MTRLIYRIAHHHRMNQFLASLIKMSMVRKHQFQTPHYIHQQQTIALFVSLLKRKKHLRLIIEEYLVWLGYQFSQSLVCRANQNTVPQVVLCCVFPGMLCCSLWPGQSHEVCSMYHATIQIEYFDTFSSKSRLFRSFCIYRKSFQMKGMFLNQSNPLCQKLGIFTLYL